MELTSKHTQSNGYTLIELMIVIAVVSLLAAIGLSSFLDYVIRARLSDVMMSNRQYKLAVEQSIYDNGVSLANLSEEDRLRKIGYSQTGEAELIEQIAVGDDSSITVTLVNSESLGDAAAAEYTMTPTITGSGAIRWTCNISTVAAQQVLRDVCN